MARSFAQLHLSIWTDDDFKDLTENAQRLYFLLISQSDMTYCGVVPYRTGRWVKFAKDSKPARIRSAIAELIEQTYITVDTETEEIWVRSFIRRNKVIEQAQLLLSLKGTYPHIASAKIKWAVYEAVPEDKRDGMTPPKGWPDPEGGGQGRPQGQEQGGPQGNGKPHPQGPVIGVRESVKGVELEPETSPVTETPTEPEPVSRTSNHNGNGPHVSEQTDSAEPALPEIASHKAEERRVFAWTDTAMDLFEFPTSKFVPTQRVMRLACAKLDDKLIEQCLRYCADRDDKPRTPKYLHTALHQWAGGCGILIPPPLEAAS